MLEVEPTGPSWPEVAKTQRNRREHRFISINDMSLSNCHWREAYRFATRYLVTFDLVNVRTRESAICYCLRPRRARCSGSRSDVRRRGYYSEAYVGGFRQRHDVGGLRLHLVDSSAFRASYHAVGQT